MSEINNPHDKFFKSAMSNHRVARAFMQQHLPASILSVTDLSTLELQKESYVDEHLSQKITDILYRAKIKDRDGYLYILTEHQSRPEPMMPFRLLDYTCQIMRHHVEDLDQHVLPVVVPLVFYNGSKKYSHSTDIFDLFGESELLARQLLFKPFHLIDLSQIPDDTLKENAWAGVLGFMQKHIHARNLLQRIDEIVPLLKKLMALGADGYIIRALCYAVNSGNIDSIDGLDKLTHGLSPKIGDEVMTLADRLRAEGRDQAKAEFKTLADRLRAEGRKQGREKGRTQGRAQGRTEGRTQGRAEGVAVTAKKLLSEGVNAELVSRVTGLSLEALNSLVINQSVSS